MRDQEAAAAASSLVPTQVVTLTPERCIFDLLDENLAQHSGSVAVQAHLAGPSN